MNRAERRQQKKLAKRTAKGKVGQGAQASAQLAALFQAAVSAYQAGDRAQAETLCQQILRLAPDHADAAHLLGILLFQRGDTKAALTQVEKAIAAAPQPSFHNSLGNILKATGRLDAAAESYRQAVAAQPAYPEAHCNLGNCLRLMHRPAEAASCYRTAIAQQPGNVAAHTNLGLVLTEMGQYADAIASCRKAVELKPDHAIAHINLGNALKESGAPNEAEASYMRAIELQPDMVEAHMALAGLLKGVGRSDEAAASYQAAALLAAEPAEALRLWAHTRKHRERDAELEAMAAAFAASAPASEARMHLGFGLGKAFEDLRRYDEAFEYLREGNRIKHANHPAPLEQESEAFFAALKEVFCPELFAGFQGAGDPDAAPIFILGMPRSGTSLIEQVLASHSKVQGGGELPVLPELVRSEFEGNGDIAFVRSLPSVSRAKLREVGEAYVSALRARVGDAPHVSDKRPLNFVLVGLIRLILPNAKVIHCARSPMDTCYSIYKSYFPTRNFQFADDLQALGRYYNHYHDLMQHWHNVLPGFVHDVHYEDMIADQEGQTRRLLGLCGLAWEEDCLEFYRTRRQVRTASAEQVRQPIYSSSVALWKRYEPHLAPLLEQLETGRAGSG